MNTLKFVLWMLAINVMRASDTQFLKAIAEVETGNNPSVVGADGEVSAYQLLPQNWFRYTDEPISHAKDKPVAFCVASCHLAWIKRQLKVARPECTDAQRENPYLLAIAWRWGPHNTRGFSDEKNDYALRVVNVYGEIKYSANNP